MVESTHRQLASRDLGRDPPDRAWPSGAAGSAPDARYRRFTLVYIAVFCLVWWGIYTFGRDYLDGRDMVENFGWGMEWQWGYDKHPPLFSWITAGWFKLFPFSDGSYYLLNQLNLAIALWLLALAMRRFMDWDRVLVAIMLTSLGTHFGPDSGYKYNANSALLPFVAGFVWTLLQGLERDRIDKFVLAGLFAAAALLTKYYALVMFAAVGLAVMIALRPPWRRLLKGASITAIPVVLLVLPHIVWSQRHGWPSVRYMHSVHQYGDFATVFKAHATTLGDSLHFSGIALLVWAVSLVRLPAMRLAGDLRRPRLGLLSFVLGVALTLLSALAQQITPVSPWLIPVMLFAGWVLVDLTPATADMRVLARRVAIGAAAYLVISVLLAAVLARQHHAYPARPAYALPQNVAEDATRLYRQAYAKPVEYVAGTTPLPYTLSFYSPDHPHGLAGLDLVRSSWIDPRALAAGNKLVVCGTLVFDAGEDALCAPAARALFGPPDQVRQLVYPVYDPPSRKMGLQRFDVLMYKPLAPN